MADIEMMTIAMRNVLKGGAWIGDRHFYWPAANTVGRVPKAMGADAIGRGWAEEVDDPQGDAPIPGENYTESP